MKLVTLGGLKVEGSPLTRPKPLLLLAYLALEGSRDRRDLAELFFMGNQDPMQGLRVSLSHLNKEAAGAVRASDKRLWTELKSDIAELESELALGNFEGILELYKGPFLEGFDLTDLGEELEEWLYSVRERIASQVREAHLRLAERSARKSEFSEAAHLAEKAYVLRYAPEPEPDTLERIYTLLRAGEAATESIVKEAKSYGLELFLTVDEARAKLRTLPPQAQSLPANPYVGLSAFQESDAAFFFGRERATHDIVQRCQTSPFVVTVIGNSGAGKSSLVLAGVLPELRKNNWLICTLRPGRQPFEALGLALNDLLETSSEPFESQPFAGDLQEKKLELTGLVSTILSNHPRQRLLMVVDQLEELFTISEGDSEAANFLEVLLNAVQHFQGQLSLIVTLRADFIGALLEYPPILTMLQESRYFLGPMTEAELRVAVVEPARRLGVTFEAGLVERILDDVSGQEGSLPLLEFALTQLWEKQEHHTLTHHAYDAIGGVEEALANHADMTFNNLNESEQRLAQKVFLQLVYPGTGQEDTRRMATREELEDAWSVVQTLASYPARLLVTGYSETGEQTAEVSHEALIRRWGRLRNWMSDYRTFRTWQERLRQDVKLWNEQKYVKVSELTPNKLEATLLRGYRLDEALQHLKQNEELLGENERNFIGQSLTLRERETLERTAQRQQQLESLQKLASEETSRRKAEQARVRLRNNALWLLTLLGCIAGVLAVISYNARNQAVTARNETTALLPKLLSSVALNSKEETPQRSLLLALEAERMASQNNQPDLPSIQRMLRQLVSETGGVSFPHPDSVRATTFSPDGRWLVTGSNDKKVRFWNLETRKLALTLENHTDYLTTVRFNPDGSLFATAGHDQVIQIWDASKVNTNNAEAPTLVKRLEGFEDIVSDFMFSPDGRLLATLSMDLKMRLWDTGSWRLLASWDVPGLTTWSLAFSPDGVWLAVSSAGDTQGFLSLWQTRDLETTNAQPLILSLRAPSKGLGFSPDSRWLAVGRADGQTDLWQLSQFNESLLQASPPALTLAGHSDTVLDAAFSPDNFWLATSSQDKTIRLWFMDDLEARASGGNRELRSVVLRGHEDGVSNLAFNVNGHWLASGSYDGSARLWDLRLPSSDLAVLPAHGDGERRTDISPDGTLLASGNLDGTLYLQHLGDAPQSSVVLGKHDSWVESLAFSPEGDFLVSASDASNGGERVLELWNLLENPVTATPFTLTKNSKTIFDVAFSSDGKIIASAGEDKTAQLWNVDDLSQPLATFAPHGDIVTDVVFSPDNKLLATASFDSFVRIWKVEDSSQPPQTLEGHENGVRTLAFSPDGLLLATGGQDGKVKIWLTKTWEVTKTLEVGSRVWAVSFSPEGQTLATANEDGTLGLWQRNTEEFEKLSGHTNTVWSVSFSRDGKWIVTASEDGTVRFWPASMDEVRSLACQKAGRNLHQEEWQEMFGAMTYQMTCPQFSEAY
jgi:WD40 repeat protein